MNDLWGENSPDRFWMCEPSPAPGEWEQAIRRAMAALRLPEASDSPEDLLRLTLGEGRFGPGHWTLPRMFRLYYRLKPFIPRALISVLRRAHSRREHQKPAANWPTDARYAAFQWELLQQLSVVRGEASICYRALWPDGHRFAFVLTHDIETARGQAFVREVADLEERHGFRSCFNFVLDRYPLDLGLMQELRERGFEVGCHGLKHDGHLFDSRPIFLSRAHAINQEMRRHGMVGFRSPLTLRNPLWLQELEIEYDASFFDTDPFEPIPGGAMTIWPFFLGRLVELPYTLVQDHTLTSILGARTPDIWLDKVDFIRRNQGMALLITHPDYLRESTTYQVYTDFLGAMAQSTHYWHALPRDIAAWWRRRSDPSAPAAKQLFQATPAELPGVVK